jgi:hypothetical protein
MRGESVAERNSYRVRDGQAERFRSFVEGAIERHGGNARAAAVAYVSQQRIGAKARPRAIAAAHQRLYHLVKGKLPQRAPEQTVATLRWLAPDLPWEDVLVLRSEASAYESTLAWLTAEYESTIRSHGTLWIEQPNGELVPVGPVDENGDLVKLRELEALKAEMRALYPEQFGRLDTLARQRGHSDRRLELAHTRVVKPLLDAKETGGIERHWRTLSDEELARFIACGVDRELIMLDRPGDMTEARRSHEAQRSAALADLQRADAERRAGHARKRQAATAAWIANEKLTPRPRRAIADELDEGRAFAEAERAKSRPNADRAPEAQPSGQLVPPPLAIAPRARKSQRTGSATKKPSRGNTRRPKG